MDRTFATQKEKANRLIQLRKIARLDRNNMAQIAGVSIHTYKGWENGRFGGIPKKRAEFLAESLQTEGIQVSLNWLMDGNGDQPKKISFYHISQLKGAAKDTAKQKPPEYIEQLRIKAELEFFCNNNWNTLSTTLTDDAMEPYFSQGDIIAGVKTPYDDFEKTIGLNCIVLTKNNKLLLRQIQNSNTKGLFTLLSLNPNSKQQRVLHDVELIDIAPVLWIRKHTIWYPENFHKK